MFLTAKNWKKNLHKIIAVPEAAYDARRQCKKKEILNNPLDTEKCIKNALTTV